MAGSMILNPSSRYAPQFTSIVPSLEIPPLYVKDAQVLERNSRDYLDRVNRCNRNANDLATWLSRQTDRVQAVFYPGLPEVERGKVGVDNDDGSSLQESNSHTDDNSSWGRGINNINNDKRN